MNKLKYFHKEGWFGLIRIMHYRQFYSKLPFLSATIFTLLITVILLLSKNVDSYKVLTETSSLLIGFFPNLLGFSLGGFAIVVSFSNSDLLTSTAESLKPSVFQILSTTFSYCILFQVVVTILSFFITWCIKIEVFTINDNQILCEIVNFLLLTIVLFFTLLSLFLTPYIVINLFSLSQMNSLFFSLKKIKNDSIKK